MNQESVFMYCCCVMSHRCIVKIIICLVFSIWPLRGLLISSISHINTEINSICPMFRAKAAMNHSTQFNDLRSTAPILSVLMDYMNLVPFSVPITLRLCLMT
jgi:hypothetical protein